MTKKDELPTASAHHDEILSLLRTADCHYGGTLRDEEEGLTVAQAAHKRDKVLASRIAELRKAVHMIANGQHSVTNTEAGHEDAALRALLHFQGDMSPGLQQHILTRLATLQPQFGLRATTNPLRCVTRGAAARRRRKPPTPGWEE
jgi:hypothetical protein